MPHFKNATFQTGFSRRRIRTRHSSSGPQRRAHVGGRTLQGRRHPKPEVVAKSRQTRGTHFRQRRRPVDAQPARLRSGANLIKRFFSSSLLFRHNKLQCLRTESLSSQVHYFRVCPLQLKGTPLG